MQRRFSEMTREELINEAGRIREEAKKKTKEGMISEGNMLEKKFYLCVSYLLDPKQYLPGESYQIQGENGEFMVKYLNGVFAWGYKNDRTNVDELVAYPIGQLYKDHVLHPF